jgi:uncharacterized membrane protein YcaP (DUF421 family)
MLEHAIAWLQGDDILATTVRTLFVYGFALVLVRLGSKRFLSKASAFDFIVAIMLGSILSRALRPSADLGPNLLSAALLVAVHWILAALSSRLDWFGPLVKGKPTLLVRDGQTDRQAMRQSGVSEQDLEQAIRLQARRTDATQVRLATLERDGSISVIPAERPPAVLDVQVENGVQTVRIRLE